MTSWVARSEVLTKNVRGIMKSHSVMWCAGTVMTATLMLRRWWTLMLCSRCHAEVDTGHVTGDKRRDWHERRPIGTRRQLARLTRCARVSLSSRRRQATTHASSVTGYTCVSHLLRFISHWDALSHCDCL